MLKKILNYHEEQTYQSLAAVCNRHDVRVFPKVRVADVFQINKSGISDDLFSFALKAHFDFVAAGPDHTALFVVEFDGPSHEDAEQKERDAKKDELCERFRLPHLRVNGAFVNRSYRKLNLVTWFLETWFASRYFEEAQARGEIAHDEAFDPTFFVTVPGHDREYPLWLSAEPNGKIQKLWREKRCLDWLPTLVLGADDNEVWHAMRCLRIDESRAVRTYAKVRGQRFPVSMLTVMREVAPFDVCQRLLDALYGASEPESVECVREASRRFRKDIRNVASVGLCWLD